MSLTTSLLVPVKASALEQDRFTGTLTHVLRSQGIQLRKITRDLREARSWSCLMDS